MFKLPIFQVLALSLLSFHLYTMEKPEDGHSIRKEIENSESTQAPAKKAKCDPDIEKELTTLEITKQIYNLNVTALSTYLSQDSCKFLNYEDKYALFKLAAEHANKIDEFAKLGSQLTANTQDPYIKELFAHNRETLASRHNALILNAFLYLKNFKFPQALFTPRKLPYYPPLDKALESLISTEQQEIYSSCFHLTLYNIAAALAEKKKEGIQVEIVTNQNQGGNPILQPIKHLIASGIQVLTPRSSGYEMNHHKFFIFKNNILNKSLLWTGSYNPTGNSNHNSWDDVIILDDIDVIKDYENRFKEIKSASKPITMQELQNIPSNPSSWTLGQNNVPRELWNKSEK